MQLTFRETGLKPETKRKMIVLLVVFIVALVFFYIFLNRDKEEDVTDFDAPTLPVVTIEAMGQSLNELHGYVVDMDSLYMRDAVVPLDDRTLPIEIRTYGRDISAITYEIRSLDTERKIAEDQIEDFTEQDGTIRATVNVASLVEDGDEVLLILKLNSEGDTIRYYTRIVVTEEDATEACLTFAMNFHEMALQKNQDYISDYLETEDSDDTAQLYDVSINSTASQVAWGNFDGTVVGDVVTELTDVSDDYVSLVLYFEMERQGTSGTERFRVEEYFRVRYTADQMYLLDYQRDMEQEMGAGDITVTGGALPLGVTDRDVNFLSNETGSVVAFESDGALYEYNENTGELLTVFSFGSNTEDERLKNMEHDILILNIDENGTMDFVVYGYMNAGPHEGMCGINLYHFDSGTKRSIEQTFIQSTKSYEILKAGFSELIYESTDSIFYIIVDGTLLGVDLNTLEINEIETQMAREQYAVSGSGRYFAWIEDRTPSSTLKILDLETRSEFSISAGDGELLRPVAFMDEDLVYGIIRESDIGTDAAGSTIYPMYQIQISDIENGTETPIKTYSKDGYYVTDVTKDSYTLYLTRVTRSDNGYVEAEDDTIKDSAGAKNRAISIVTSSDDVLGTVLSLQMKTDTDTTAKLVTTGIVNASESRIISVHAMDMETEYFVYVGARVVYAGADLTKAIRTADEEMGLVLDNSHTYIWKRSRRSYVNAFSGIAVGSLDQTADTRSKAISALINYAGESVDVHTSLASGETPLSIITSTLKDQKVLDLTGLTMTEILYYISEGYPVYTETSSESVLLVGYDATNIYVYHPDSLTISFESRMTYEEELQSAGSVYISYID